MGAASSEPAGSGEHRGVPAEEELQLCRGAGGGQELLKKGCHNSRVTRGWGTWNGSSSDNTQLAVTDCPVSAWGRAESGGGSWTHRQGLAQKLTVEMLWGFGGSSGRTGLQSK